jgi:hypothetical protein
MGIGEALVCVGDPLAEDYSDKLVRDIHPLRSRGYYSSGYSRIRSFGLQSMSKSDGVRTTPKVARYEQGSSGWCMVRTYVNSVMRIYWLD